MMAKKPLKKKTAKSPKRASLKKNPKAPSKVSGTASRIQKRPVKKPHLRVSVRPHPILGELDPVIPIFSAAGRQLPERYHQDRLTLMVRDPWWIFAYWEVTEGRETYVMNQLRREGLSREKTVIRVYDITDTTIEKAHSFFDIELHFIANNWYIDVGKPGRSWIAEVGIRAHGGRFFPLVRSNVVKTPPHGISDVLDEEWMMPDEMFFRLFGDLSLLQQKGGSMDIRKLLEKYFKPASSETSSKFSKPV